MKLYLKPRVLKQLQKIPSPFRKLIEQRIEILENEPFPTHCKKLAGREGWRIRVGDYRILYVVYKRKKELTVLSVAHRKDAYK